MGWIPTEGKPIKLNGAFHINSSILQFIVASAAEAELGALFHNCQTGIIFPSILEDLGHQQPKKGLCIAKTQQRLELQTILLNVDGHIQ
jgi:hypothetical protein